jgi:hypothetical protein
MDIRERRICEAIRMRCVLAFDYDGKHRLVAPYCHGVTSTGAETLRAVQVAGSTRSGGLGFGKLWTVAKMRGLVITDTRFAAVDPDYNPADTARAEIHCCVEKG